MKKFILLITAITGLVVSGFCQSDTSTAKINNVYTSNQYLVKAENQKIGAWILLGAGAVSASLAALRIPTALDGSQESSSGSFFLITGLAALLAVSRYLVLHPKIKKSAWSFLLKMKRYSSYLKMALFIEQFPY